MPPYPEDNTIYNLPPNITELNPNEKNAQKVNESIKRKYEIKWLSVVNLGIIHVIALYGIFLIPTAHIATILLGVVAKYITGYGITAGAHRLWSHRSYKAKLPLKVLLLIAQTMGHQNSVIHWCRDHRMHHKFEDTDADPYNAKNGFFFSNVGWLMCKKHEDVKIKSKGIDFSDLYADPLLRFQHKYFIPLMLLACFIVPTALPILLWNETFVHAFTICVVRYVYILNVSWLVNSWAHLYGTKPYDKNISATQSRFVAFLAGGEGWHNFHHVFPWDYRAAENAKHNTTMPVLNFFAKIGWAYDLRFASEDMIKQRVYRTGDGTHEKWGVGKKRCD